MTIYGASEHIAVGGIKVQIAIRSEASPASYRTLTSGAHELGVHPETMSVASAGTHDAIATTSHGAVDAAVSLVTYLATRDAT